MKKFRFHLISLAHLPQSKEYLSCAFTQKNRKLAKMLTSLGHDVIFYGPEGSDVLDYAGYEAGTIQFVETHKIADIARDYGDGDNRFEIGYNWKNVDFRHDMNSERKMSTLKFYASCINHINANKQPDDFLLCTQGVYHKPIADAVKLFLTCETGIGYRGSVKEWYRAFESAYIQNFSYGSENPWASLSGSYYDRVIPNYFDPDDVKFSDKKGDYYLFIGRMIKRKGVITAIETCNYLKKKLIMVGQGATVEPDGSIHDSNPQEWTRPAGTWEYQGFADVEKRKELMANAIAVFTPTEYLECFGGTHVEAMLSGTPVITTNFGVFGGDTFQNGVHGFKCNTMDDFVDAAKRAKGLDPLTIRKHAERFLMDNVRWDFQRWFDDLYQLYLSTTDKNIKAFNHVRTENPGWREMIHW